MRGDEFARPGGWILLLGIIQEADIPPIPTCLRTSAIVTARIFTDMHLLYLIAGRHSQDTISCVPSKLP